MRTRSLMAGAALLATALQVVGQSGAPLSQLIAEAEASNAKIHAAEHDWRAVTQVRKQVTTLPDPQFTLQEFSVGSPKPFAGFTTSNFAYIGIGASQELPYPQKLRLKGLAADRAAEAAGAQIEVMRTSVAEQVKSSYLRLAYLQEMLALFEASRGTIHQIIQTQLARYSTGQGSQAEILQAQLEQTKLVRGIAAVHGQMAQVQADLKQVLHRPQEATDIVAEDLAPTPLRHTSQELLALVRRQNPVIQFDARTVDRHSAELKSAERAGKPDFSIGYMYQRTGTDFPAYYMLTLGMTLPRRRRVDAQISQAVENVRSARDQLDAQLQQQLAEVEKQYAAVTSTAEILTDYREGMLPQADAAFQSMLASYSSNREQLAPVLASLNVVYELKRDYAQTLLDHELAIARLETLTGETLR
ncbi:MAG: TolC family protein [Acidobacteriota bacterium]|nr:TolC family protein [Acidobacteriota bacterium]